MLPLNVTPSQNSVNIYNVFISVTSPTAKYIRKKLLDSTASTVGQLCVPAATLMEVIECTGAPKKNMRHFLVAILCKRNVQAPNAMIGVVVILRRFSLWRHTPPRPPPPLPPLPPPPPLPSSSSSSNSLSYLSVSNARQLIGSCIRKHNERHRFLSCAIAISIGGLVSVLASS